MKKRLKHVKEVKKLISDLITKREKGISVSIWQPKETDMDRIVIKFPRNFTNFIGFSIMKEKILDRYGFHIAQIMGFMEDKKLWVLIVRDRR